ncbi:metalloregulator ArsR/SmtB family transcription factor [Fodinicola acaciae]|uniref:metalloregulator ArsR/SmtB family transcription factor n=1 Tax=Fodinicola acaciae TaxID=2681555 RepID=UPI001FEBDBD7|nr:metalloregulator ArsR/SmtB family transcription factor [Fodinicola acaciae]
MRAASAIADPVRRRILVMLRDSRRTAGEIAASFDISRPAVSRHLRVLRECGLVHDELVGRERIYRLDPAPLDEIAEWIDQFRRPADWEHRFDALQTEVYRARRERAQDREETG